MANKSSNASATEFGFDFQHNAGIVLMLKFIKSVESVRCEGNFEDVELTLVSKKKIYAQAKALVNPDMHKSIVSKMGDALESLNRADKNGDAEELVFVTNCPNPFNDMASIQSFAIGVPLIAYDELPSTAKEKLESMYVRRGVSFDKRKFKVLTFYFRDGDNKYNIVKDAVNEFLAGLDIPQCVGKGREILENWQLAMQQNASDTDLSAKITKKKMLWALIVLLCAWCDDSEWIDESDACEIEDVKRAYCGLIDDAAEGFEFVTKVLSGYACFRDQHADLSPKASRSGFICEKWQAYSSEFKVDDNLPRVKEIVTKLAIDKIISNREKIKKVREATNLK